jgi:hypothetical protein
MKSNCLDYNKSFISVIIRLIIFSPLLFPNTLIGQDTLKLELPTFNKELDCDGKRLYILRSNSERIDFPHDVSIERSEFINLLEQSFPSDKRKK